MTEDEMAEWHNQLNGYEFEQTLGDSEWQGILVHRILCDPKESDMTERVNSNIGLQWSQIGPLDPTLQATSTSRIFNSPRGAHLFAILF